MAHSYAVLCCRRSIDRFTHNLRSILPDAPATADLRAIFTPGAAITRVTPDTADTWTVDAFIAPRAAMLSDGTLTDFHECEVEAETTVPGDIASRRSVYEKQGLLHGQPYAGRGRKFIQLCRVHCR